MHSYEGNRIVMIDIDTNGRTEERIPGTGQESWLDTTLLGAMYPNIHVALVSVPTEPLDDFEEASVANAMTAVSHNGIAYKMVGASGSAKNGKYYYCDAAHEPLIAKRFQQWPEAAITYFGILVSDCKVVRKEPEARVLVVRDLELGTNDCRGWIRRSLFKKLAPGSWTPLRVELFPFAHVFRNGSRIRLIVSGPGGGSNAWPWAFDALRGGFGVRIAHDGKDRSSSVVLPIVEPKDLSLPPSLPDRDSIWLQPCRAVA